MCFLTVLLRLFLNVFFSFLLDVCAFWFLVCINPVVSSLVVFFSPLFAVFIADLIFRFLFLAKRAVDIRANILSSLAIRVFIYLLFVPVQSITSYNVYPHHLWAFVYLRPCVRSFCRGCCFCLDHGHKCVGSAQVCLSTWLVSVCVCEWCFLVPGALSLNLSRSVSFFISFLHLYNFFLSMNSNVTLIFR